MTTTATHTMVGPLTANGVAQLPFDFQAISKDEVGVIRNGVELITGYAVFINPDGTGYVTPNTSWGTSQVFIFSRPFFTQETEFDRGEPFYPDALNHPFDILGRQILALKNSSAAAAIDDTPYGPSWDGVMTVAPSKNAVYDKIESLDLGGGGGGTAADDTPYGASWDGVTDVAPSKNAVYDKIEALTVGGGGVVTFNGRSGAVVLTSADVTTALAFTPASVGQLGSYLPLVGGTLTGNLTVPAEAYGVAWNGALTVPTKDAVYDRIELLTAAITASAPLVPREQDLVSAATVTPTFTNDIVNISAQAVALTLANWSGTAVRNHGMVIRIRDAGVAVNINYGSNYRGIGVALPAVSVVGKVLYLGAIWNPGEGKIDVVSVMQYY